MKIFGERNYDLNYWKRTGAYAVIQNHQQQFLCVEDLDGNLFLVGGGVEADEAPENALLRESIEETGHKIQIVETIGKAERHWVSAKYPRDSQHNIGILYACELLERIAEPVEKEPMCWVDFSYLEKYLFHEHHLYLIKQYLNNYT
ncbi:NUDIX domain-containing protein [Virgibacillus halodenitrificans]|uniref:NUDIX domain-containing protein n=1 Tax=Virgibacillus halodenitrificans TaxID=1482 RepID=UPI00136CACC3|nr:NUDIX domain-containing protein [Virgibacillus halodenitrificans]MCJ0930170.1 NUDIX domain-containing protein [Virgibacillus halodenitrificans]MYL47570.1 NUDIX domain-containing protein [Virgibacillus halodenitrificans]